MEKRYHIKCRGIDVLGNQGAPITYVMFHRTCCDHEKTLRFIAASAIMGIWAHGENDILVSPIRLHWIVKDIPPPPSV
jgi:hypothetical protein